jgi:peptidoglycan/xylan/chitin deacetylase (PgdA/CDA1 family)
MARPLIVAYHTVSSTWASSLAIDEASFDAQLAYLRRRGYVGLTLSEAERRRRIGGLPQRALVVTFDDGYASTLNAKPTLDRLGYPATVFVVTSFVDSGDALTWYGVENRGDAAERRPLGWHDLRALRDAGWEVGSHTVTHPLLTRLDEPALGSELEDSRRRLDQELGACTSIAYPYGQADARVAARAQEAGYEVGCTLTGAHLGDAALLRPRVGLAPADRGARLAAKVSRPGVALRRSPAARAARRLRRRRPWLPGG